MIQLSFTSVVQKLSLILICSILCIIINVEDDYCNESLDTRTAQRP